MFGRSRQPWITTDGSGTRADPRQKHRGGRPWTAARPVTIFGLHFVHEAQTFLHWWERSIGVQQREHMQLVCACGAVRLCDATGLSPWLKPETSAAPARSDQVVARELAGAAS